MSLQEDLDLIKREYSDNDEAFASISALESKIKKHKLYKNLKEHDAIGEFLLPAIRGIIDRQERFLQDQKADDLAKQENVALRARIEGYVAAFTWLLRLFDEVDERLESNQKRVEKYKKQAQNN